MAQIACVHPHLYHSEFLTHCLNSSKCLGLENVTELFPPNVFILYKIGEGRYLTRAAGTTIFPSTAWPRGQCETLVKDRAVRARAPFTHFLRRSAPTSPLALPSLGRFFPALLTSAPLLRVWQCGGAFSS